MKMHQKKDAKTIYISSSQNLHYKTKTPARSNIINNKRSFRASGLSLLPLALRPGLLLVGERNATTKRSDEIKINAMLRSLAFLLVLLTMSFILQNSYTNSASAASLTLTIPNSISLDINPSSNNGFNKSSSSTLSVKTDVGYGYTLSIKSKDSANSNNLVNGSAKLTSIASPMDETSFSTSSASNTWGYLPSKLGSIDNSNFQPGPTSEATILDTTDSASEGTNYDFTLAAKVDSTIPIGSYTNTFVLTATSNEPPIPTMQNWSGCDELSYGQSVELQDIRDKKMYTVAKLDDGRCWMTKNLEIADYTLTSDDSDVESEFTLPASSPDGFKDSNVANVYIDSTYGGYYTSYAATAGEGTAREESDTIPHSICPKGWGLPIKAEFDALLSSQLIPNMTGSPANFLLGGQYINGSPSSDKGSKGYYLSSIRSGLFSDYYLYVSSGDARISYHDDLDLFHDYYGDGYSVRCVARESGKKYYSITYSPGKDSCNNSHSFSTKVSNMPFPNPQVGVTSSESITLSSSIPSVPSSYQDAPGKFKFWCDTSPTNYDECPGRTYLPNASFPLNRMLNYDATLWAVWETSVKENEFVCVGEAVD